MTVFKTITTVIALLLNFTNTFSNISNSKASDFLVRGPRPEISLIGNMRGGGGSNFTFLSCYVFVVLFWHDIHSRLVAQC